MPRPRGIFPARRQHFLPLEARKAVIVRTIVVLCLLFRFPLRDRSYDKGLSFDLSKLYPIDIILFGSIKTAHNEQEGIKVHDGLVECPLAWGSAKIDDPCPSFSIERELVYVVEPLLLLVNTSMYVHGVIVAGSCMAVAALDFAFAATKSRYGDLPLA